MIRRAALLMVFSLLLVTMGPNAQGSKVEERRTERVVQESYESPMPGVPGVLRVGVCGGFGLPATGCIDLHQKPHERYLNLELKDSSGQTAYAEVYGSRNENLIATVCGATQEPISIDRAMEIRVFVFATGASALCPGAATEGTLTATFSNRP